MSNKKKPVSKATDKKGSEKIAEKKSVDKKMAEEKKRLDKKIIIIVAVIVAVIVGVVVFLLISGGSDGQKPTETTTAVPTTDVQKMNDEALWAEHTALFDELKNVYWLGNYDNYKNLVPLAVWEAYAAEENMTLEELYAKAEQDMVAMELPENKDIRFYISKTTRLEGEDFNLLVSQFAGEYNMDVADFEEIYELEVEVVSTIDGERKSEYDTYYSIKIDGIRYLATETGFIA